MAEEYAPGLDPSQVCGIDEAGRGPLAGPVTAGCVILGPDFPVGGLKDSKKLTPARREALSRDIFNHALAWGLGWAWPHEIDALNIHRASLLAMSRAYQQMGKKPLLALVDGKFTPSLDCPARAVVSGDNLIPAIMAASILAKTARDRWMIRYSWIEGAYGYDRHKGYPTPEHARICRELGPSPISRLSFRVPGEKDPPRRRTG